MSNIAKLSRDDIFRLQAEVAKLPQLQLQTQHFFAGGMYCRFLPRPAGTVIVGKVHLKEHLYIVCCGTVLVTTGDGAREISGPEVIVSKPGTKRAVFAITDATCLTVHRTDLTDLDEIERELLEEDYTSLFDSNNQLKFDVPAFRELTKHVISGEKFGFWSDWTPEQRTLYSSGRWHEFSESRGYSTEQIAEYEAWRNAIKVAEDSGLNPFAFIVDLATDAALENIKLDIRGEIALSSHAPF